MDPEKLERFACAFSSGMAGCRRTCQCGKEFYDDWNTVDWEPGELERLKKDPNAVPLGYSVDTVLFEGAERVTNCTCWHERAEKIMAFIDGHAHQIAEYLTLEKKAKQAEADNAPTVEAE